MPSGASGDFLASMIFLPGLSSSFLGVLVQDDYSSFALLVGSPRWKIFDVDS